MLPSNSDRDAELLAREMILAHEKWLPNFADCIAAISRGAVNTRSSSTGPQVNVFYAGFLGPHGTSRLADLTRHIRHMIQVGGLDLVALGSDFDGIDCPLELEDAGHMDRLVQAMEGAGFTPREIEAVCWKNAWEFYRRVL